MGGKDTSPCNEADQDGDSQPDPSSSDSQASDLHDLENDSCITESEKSESDEELAL